MAIVHGRIWPALCAWIAAAGLCAGSETTVLDSFDYADATAPFGSRSRLVTLDEGHDKGGSS